MSKLVVCEELFIFSRLVISKLSELQHGFAAKCQCDSLGLIPALQLSKEAVPIAGFDRVRLTRLHHVHVIQLVEVLCSIPQEVRWGSRCWIHKPASRECRHWAGVVSSFMGLEYL